MLNFIVCMCFIGKDSFFSQSTANIVVYPFPHLTTRLHYTWMKENQQYIYFWYFYSNRFRFQLQYKHIMHQRCITMNFIFYFFFLSLVGLRNRAFSGTNNDSISRWKQSSPKGKKNKFMLQKCEVTTSLKIELIHFHSPIFDIIFFFLERS